MKTLYIIAKGMGKKSQEEIIRLEKSNRYPRVTYFENAISAQLLDERYLQNETPWFRRWLYLLVTTETAQIIEALIICRRFDAIFSHSERVGFLLGLLFPLFRVPTPHIMLLCRITSSHSKKERLKKWLLTKAQFGINLILVWSSVQREIAVNELGIDPARIKHIKCGIDQQFWHPIERDADIICSVGMEMRDYPTLVKALRHSDIPCHIATGPARGQIFEPVQKLNQIDRLPENVTVGFKNYEELRELYARSRFVVIPLQQTDSDNGLTAILEAMAMGKAVICSKVRGQVDIIKEGETGIFVPQGDPVALRKAITSLWNDPQRAEKLGKAARKQVETLHRWEDYGAKVRKELEAVIDDRLFIDDAKGKKFELKV